MALPPIAPTRSESPERGVSPSHGNSLASRSAGGAGLGPLAPLRGFGPSDLPSPSVGPPVRNAASGAIGSAPSRSISGGQDAGPPTAVVSPTSSQSPSRRGSAVSPRVVSGPRKLTKAQLAERLHGQLMEVLRTEWRRIKSSNLGVLSGTAVVEELLLRRIQTWAAELHMLAMTHLSAAERLGELCRGMDPGELQQLLVMFDQTNHPELSDYVRVMVFNTSDPSAKTVVGDLRALKAANSANRRARSTPSTRRRQPAAPAPPPRVYNHVPEDPAVMRFAGLLPDGHRLVAGAHAAAERRKQQEEEDRRAAEAREARARARSEAANGGTGGSTSLERRQSDASARQSVLLGRGAPPDLQPYYLADVQEQWRLTINTRLPCEGVFDSCIMLQEPLPMYEAPPEAALMRAEAEEAASAPPSRPALTMASVTSRAAPSFVGGAAPGRPGGGGNWPLGPTAAATAFKRLASARPNSVGSPQASASAATAVGEGSSGGVAGGSAAAAGQDGSAPGSGAASSRFTGPSRRGPRLVSMAAEVGGEGGSGDGSGPGEGGRVGHRGVGGRSAAGSRGQGQPDQ